MKKKITQKMERKKNPKIFLSSKDSQNYFSMRNLKIGPERIFEILGISVKY